MITDWDSELISDLFIVLLDATQKIISDEEEYQIVCLNPETVLVMKSSIQGKFFGCSSMRCTLLDMNVNQVKKCIKKYGKLPETKYSADLVIEDEKNPKDFIINLMMILDNWFECKGY